MSDAVDRIVERLRQAREAQRRAMSERLEATRQQTPARAATPAIGARVFDTVTGQEGEIVGRTVENVVLPTPHGGNR